MSLNAQNFKSEFYNISRKQKCIKLPDFVAYLRNGMPRG